MAHIQDFLFYNTAAGFLSAQIITWQKDHTNSQPPAIIFMAGAGNMFNKKLARDSQMNPRPVTGHAICINRTTVPDRLQRFNSRIDH